MDTNVARQQQQEQHLHPLELPTRSVVIDNNNCSNYIYNYNNSNSNDSSSIIGGNYNSGMSALIGIKPEPLTGGGDCDSRDQSLSPVSDSEYNDKPMTIAENDCSSTGGMIPDGNVIMGLGVDGDGKLSPSNSYAGDGESHMKEGSPGTVQMTPDLSMFSQNPDFLQHFLQSQLQFQQLLAQQASTNPAAATALLASQFGIPTSSLAGFVGSAGVSSGGSASSPFGSSLTSNNPIQTEPLSLKVASSSSHSVGSSSLLPGSAIGVGSLHHTLGHHHHQQHATGSTNLPSGGSNGTTQPSPSTSSTSNNEAESMSNSGDPLSPKDDVGECETMEGKPPPNGNQQTWSYEEQFKQLYDLSDDPKRKEFLDDLFSFMQKRGSPVTRIPIMAKQVLDLYELYRLVTENGGLVEVINKKLWREITKGLNLPNSITSAAFTLRTQYMKFLYPYECTKKGLSTKDELQQAIDGNRREGRRSGFTPYPAPSSTGLLQSAARHHVMNGSAGFPDLSSPTMHDHDGTMTPPLNNLNNLNNLSNPLLAMYHPSPFMQQSRNVIRNVADQQQQQAAAAMRIAQIQQAATHAILANSIRVSSAAGASHLNHSSSSLNIGGGLGGGASVSSSTGGSNCGGGGNTNGGGLIPLMNGSSNASTGGSRHGGGCEGRNGGMMPGSERSTPDRSVETPPATKRPRRSSVHSSSNEDEPPSSHLGAGFGSMKLTNGGGQGSIGSSTHLKFTNRSDNSMAVSMEINGIYYQGVLHAKQMAGPNSSLRLPSVSQ